MVFRAALQVNTAKRSRSNIYFGVRKMSKEHLEIRQNNEKSVSVWRNQRSTLEASSKDVSIFQEERP